jgi:hypothetical protein
MKNMMLAIVLASAAIMMSAAPQTIPRDPKVWTLDYSVGGGKAGLDRHLRMTQSGELVVGNFESIDGYGSHVASHASSELMAKVTEFLKTARKASPTSGAPIPDAQYRTLTVTAAGRTEELVLPDDVASLLEATMDTTLKKAFVGGWWQSAWKLCQPAAQLTAEDVDPPIEKLVFQEDGRFSVTWRGSGAHTTRLPHAFIPNYSGRYVLSPAFSFIQMSFEPDGYVPRDFSGEGHYRIDGDTLVLQNIWLGTQQAKRKPNICELTFARVS